jgi:zinc transport system ATP-binding protein
VSDEKVLISVENVSFGYGPTTVLDRVSFPIYEGDFLAILGPNGSGKTTLVKIILGLLRPGGGRVLLMGKSLDSFTEWYKLGYVPQKAAHIDLFFPASVREVVAMAIFSHRSRLRLSKKEGQSAVSLALRQVDMEEFAERAIGSLSGGQQQRIFIARALVTSPRVLILDEPTTGVDRQTQEMFYDMLHDINTSRGITIILITHDIGIVNRHITRVACLNQQLVYHGSHEEFCHSQAFKDMLAGGHHLISHRH